MPYRSSLVALQRLPNGKLRAVPHRFRPNRNQLRSRTTCCDAPAGTHSGDCPKRGPSDRDKMRIAAASQRGLPLPEIPAPNSTSQYRRQQRFAPRSPDSDAPFVRTAQRRNSSWSPPRRASPPRDSDELWEATRRTPALATPREAIDPIGGWLLGCLLIFAAAAAGAAIVRALGLPLPVTAMGVAVIFGTGFFAVYFSYRRAFESQSRSTQGYSW